MRRNEAMKYVSLARLVDAYKAGELGPANVVDVDNDSVYLYVGDDDDAENVYRFDGRPEDLLIEALAMLGVPADHV